MMISASNYGCPVRRLGARGFTLVEILIVVIILAILATVIIPQFSNATQQTKENMLRENLRIMRTQIGIYKAQHSGPPGVDSGGAAAPETFVSQMTKYTNQQGEVSDTPSGAYPLGPYLRAIPENSVTNDDAVLVVASRPAAASNPPGGWVYYPDELVFKADVQGTDLTLKSYFEY